MIEACGRQATERHVARLASCGLRGVGAALILVTAAAAAPNQGKPATPQPAPRPAVPPDPTRPARQAEAVGLDRCVPVLEIMGRQTLTRTYDLQSGWSRADPAHHVFQSVMALTSPGNVPADGVTALIAAPVTAGGCDGVAVQVFPLAGDCEAAEKAVLTTGHLIAPMMNTRIMLDGQGKRVILLPGYANTCIAISVDSHFGAP